MIVDPEKVASLIAEIAEEEIMSRFGALAETDIDTKSGPNDFVTAADHAAEARLEKALTGLYPAASFVGEESAAADPALVNRLETENGAFWIVDPLDGTRNFVQGREEFGTIVALIENGEIRQGWIYAIPDKGCAIGSKHDGATWRGECLGPIAAKEENLCGYRAAGSLQGKWKDDWLPRLRAEFETEPARCSAYAYINLARGLRDFAIYSRVYPWDHAAGVLMLREIGGKVAYLPEGAPYRPHVTVGTPLLASGATEIWRFVNQATLAAQ
ncbi:inositol monophosphatase family protein [Hyphococcus sp.]|uniref:inositol monophosphatase family protein n=1 Tax=Hyphococcus sp. TaxID=2038636 RepID=UPI003D0A02D3